LVLFLLRGAVDKWTTRAGGDEQKVNELHTRRLELQKEMEQLKQVVLQELLELLVLEAAEEEMLVEQVELVELVLY
jgi:hypothetical protein